MNYLDYKPLFLNTLDTAASTVLQYFAFDCKTKQFFTTQVFSNSPHENYIISRLDYSGNLIDSMVVLNGGHGTTIGVETDDDGVTWIWSNLDIVNSSGQVTGNKLVRFKYKNDNSGVEPSYTEFNKFTDVYTTPVVDQVNGLIGFRKTLSNGIQEVELRKLSDVKNGVNNLLGKVVIPQKDSDYNVMQGLAINNYDCYWYTGPSGSDHKRRITHFDFKTGQEVKEILVEFGEEPSGGYLGNFSEPEGVFFYSDPERNINMLMANITVGETDRRINKVYSFSENDSWDNFFRLRYENLQKREYYLKSNRDKQLPLNLSSMTSVRTPGRYYMSTSESNRFKDHPEPNSAGWFLDVFKGDGSSTLQILYRNSSSRASVQYFRVVNNSKEASPWQKVTTTNA